MQDEQQRGAIMMTLEQLEKRLAELEAARGRNIKAVKAMAGQLRRAKHAKTVDELSKIIVDAAGQLDAIVEKVGE